jgi:cullin-associated NEDD8-dissociated protein 1
VFSQKYLQHSSAAVRGTVISAFRYTLSDSSDAYNDVLRPLIIQILVTMLHDTDLGNHRLALTTVNSAIYNKTSQVLPHLNQLLPTIFADAHVKPELVREVTMGPFKHKVDDGLEIRKVCFPPSSCRVWHIW